MDILEQEPKHFKKSQKRTPKKSSHKHTYTRRFAMAYLRYPDGRRSPEKYKFYLPMSCTECGHSRRRYSNVPEVEIPFNEYRKLKG